MESKPTESLICKKIGWFHYVGLLIRRNIYILNILITMTDIKEIPLNKNIKLHWKTILTTHLHADQKSFSQFTRSLCERGKKKPSQLLNNSILQYICKMWSINLFWRCIPINMSVRFPWSKKSVSLSWQFRNLIFTVITRIAEHWSLLCICRVRLNNTLEWHNIDRLQIHLISLFKWVYSFTIDNQCVLCNKGFYKTPGTRDGPGCLDWTFVVKINTLKSASLIKLVNFYILFLVWSKYKST